jgi:hypothetical protein
MNCSWGRSARVSSLALVCVAGCGSDVVGGPPREIEALGAGTGTSAASRSSGAGVAPGSAGVTRSADPVAGALVNALGPRHGAWVAARSRPARSQPAGSLPSGSLPSHARALAEVALPARAHEAFALREPSSRVGIAVSLVGAQPVPRQSLDTLGARDALDASGLDAIGLYGDGAGAGTTLLLRTSAVGVEDFVAFRTAPAVPALEYRVELERDVIGLRLVERTLEFLDEAGTPRLRVAPPIVVGADGVVTPAELAVLGCAVDESPAPPWGRPPVNPGSSWCTVRVSWDGAKVSYPALVDPVWSLAASMNRPRASFASLVLSDGRVLVAGGVSSEPDGPTGSAELYDPASGTWSVTGSLRLARSAFTLTSRSLANGSAGAIAIGGQGSDEPLASSELYDPSAGTWSFGPELPVAYSGHGAVELQNGALLVAGGTTSTATSWLAPGASSWQAAGPLQADEPASTLTLLDDGSVLLVGPNPPSAQRYNPDEGSWLITGQPALARSGHTATLLLDGQVLLVGGNVAQLVELYDPASESFQFSGSTNAPHFGHTATRLADGRVAVVGGVGSGVAGGTEIYNPTWGTWLPGPGTTPTRFAHRAERVEDQLLAIGGIPVDAIDADAAGTLDGGLLASADRLDPAPIAIAIGEYKLPARLDPDVTRSTITELWASVTRPATLIDGRRYPVLMFLHGNHGTCGSGENPRTDFDCTYTYRGFCPEGSVVVPSHRGYDYVGTELAARGFIVVSVNANRGITCGDGEEGDGGFNLARGRLLLKHLQQLAAWDRGLAETPEELGQSLQGKLDLTQFGMMGHSRGGEGVRAAYEQYRDPNSPWPGRIGEPVIFRALFEIGPVDGQTSRVLNADGTAWTVLLPMCDGDVSDLQGVKPFDRMLDLISEQRETPKSTYTAWGTNHNYFNSEWQTSDSPGCEEHRALFSDGPGITGSAEQRQIGLRSMLTFFSANVGAGNNPALNELFDPSSSIESGTRVDRGYTPSLRPNRGITLEDFSAASGRSARGLPTIALNVGVAHGSVPEHDPSLRAARIDWTGAATGPAPSPPDDRWLEVPFSAAPEGIDLSDYTHLEFRTGRAEADDRLAPTPLIVQLIDATGTLSDPLDAADFGVRLDGPVGGPYNTHVVLQTARIPLASFVGAASAAVRGVRFGFPDPRGARLYLASVRASLGSASLSPVQAGGGPGRLGTTPLPVGELGAANAGSDSQVIPGARARTVRELSVEGNEVVALRAADNGRVEIELLTPRAFQAQDDHLVLDVGDVRAARSRHPGGSMNRVVFSVDARAFAGVRNGERLLVRYASNDTRQWDFGALDKSQLRP